MERLGVGMTSGQSNSGFRKPLKRGKAVTGRVGCRLQIDTSSAHRHQSCWRETARL